LLKNLKNLKQKILIHQKELQQTYPYIEQILDAISILINQNASDEMIKLWMQGALDSLIDIEHTIKHIQYNQKPYLIQELKDLKNKIDTNITLLESKYPISNTISQAIDVLLDMEAPESMIRAYLNGLEDYIQDIDAELKD
jgi:hypothetical protein